MPLESTDSLAASFTVARAQLTWVDESFLDHPTPCESWDVRALVNHMISPAIRGEPGRRCSQGRSR
jgi:hypothetical protein